jgi:hypothetical protein
MLRLTLLAVLVAGCVTVAPQADITAPPTRSVSPAATVTPSPTAMPTPTATPTPRAQPTPRPTRTRTPTPAPEFNEGWLDFLTEALGWLVTLQDDIDLISAAADSGRIRQMRPVIADALANGQDIQTWLYSNLPDPCWRDVYLAWVDFIDTYVDALYSIDYGLTPPVTADDVEYGVDQYQDATLKFFQISPTLERPDCS